MNKIMTVGELIEKLQKLDPGLPAVVLGSASRVDPVHLAGPVLRRLSKQECDTDAQVCEGRAGQLVALFWADNGQ